MCIAEVREQHPLQQGLRRTSQYCKIRITDVREQHPLQQGLRRLLVIPSFWL